MKTGGDEVFCFWLDSWCFVTEKLTLNTLNGLKDLLIFISTLESKHYLTQSVYFFWLIWSHFPAQEASHLSEDNLLQPTSLIQAAQHRWKQLTITRIYIVCVCVSVFHHSGSQVLPLPPGDTHNTWHQLWKEIGLFEGFKGAGCSFAVSHWLDNVIRV